MLTPRHASNCDVDVVEPDVVSKLQSRVGELEKALELKDKEISELKERLADAQLSADTAITQSQLLLANQSSKAAIQEQNDINDRIKAAADETLADTVDIEDVEMADADQADVGRKDADTSDKGDESLREEIVKWKARCAELEQEVEKLKAAGSAAASLELPGTGRKLQHATKARATLRGRPKSEPAATQAKEEGAREEGGEAKTEIKTEPKSEAQAVADTSEEPAPAPALSPQEEVRRKIANMGGGFNPLAGMGGSGIGINPLASLGTSGHQLKRGSISRSDEADDVDETEIRAWVARVVGDEEVKDGPAKDVFRNGTVLCRLVNTLKPGLNIKINTGKFPFMHMENINAYLRASESLGVPKQLIFAASDLYDGTNMKKVFQNLASLRKVTGSK
ncbi:Calponin-3 [Borealophlyctis nickersoniae]|nr:Calponin-3 [Borealophlyctis nickersoniae]